MTQFEDLAACCQEAMANGYSEGYHDGEEAGLAQLKVDADFATQEQINEATDEGYDMGYGDGLQRSRPRGSSGCDS
jgi:flagellar biosynthesis/type III secretory pathway protein FliH